MWQAAPNKAGLTPPPWQWWRSEIAAKFGVWPPSLIDETDYRDVAQEEEFMRLRRAYGNG